MEENLYSGKSSGFFKFYKIYIGIVTVLLVGALVFLWVKLSNFQKNYEKDSLDQIMAEQESMVLSDEELDRIAQSCFEKYINSLTMEDWVKLWYEEHPYKLDNEEDVKAFIKDKITGTAYECYKAPDFSLSSPLYYLVKGNEPLVSVSLISGKTDYSVGETKIIVTGKEMLNAEIPSGCTLIINDKEVPKDYIVSANTDILPNDDGIYVNPVTFDIYNVGGLISIPDLGAIRIKNADKTLGTALSEDGRFYETLDTVTAIEYQNKANDFIKELLAYYTKGKTNAESNMQAVLAHVKSGTKAYKIINESLSGVIWTTADENAKYVLSNSDVYIMADNCYCVDIEYLNENSEEVNKGGGIYRVYFVDEGNGFAIENFAAIK